MFFFVAIIDQVIMEVGTTREVKNVLMVFGDGIPLGFMKP